MKDSKTALEGASWASDAPFKAILNTLSDGVIVTDRRGLILLANPAIERVFGYPLQDLIGQHFLRLVPHLPDTVEGGGSMMSVLGQGLEVHGRRKDGLEVPLILSVGEMEDGPDQRFVGIFHDISARRVAEERLTLLSSAVEQAPTGILIADLKGAIEYINEGFTLLTGFTSSEMVGSNFLLEGAVLPSISGNASLTWRLLSMGQWSGEITDVTKEGIPFTAMVTFSKIQDQKGQPIRLLGRFQDMTREKQDQEALRESERRFSEVALMVGEWLWEQDHEGYYTYSSEAVSDILGYQPAEIVGRHYQDLMTAEDQRLLRESHSPVTREMRPFRKLINHYRHRDGHEVFTESTGKPLLNERGETVRWRGVDTDITAKKRVEDMVRLRERAIEAASVGIAIADAGTHEYPTIYVNAALLEMTGYSEEEILGKSLRFLQGQGTDERDRETIRTALHSGHRCEVVIKNYRKDGSGFWNELLLSPVCDEKGVLTHYIGIIADVSERRRAEHERNELAIARQIQMSLLPKRPLRLPDMEVAGLCIPAAQVGGDYYDVIRHGDCIDLVVADVSGHSVGAALLMAEMRSSLKAELRRSRPDRDSTAQLLAALNDVLFQDLDGADLFITLFYMRYHRITRQLRFASAGHNPPLLLRHEELECQLLDAEGMILGVSRDVRFEEKAITLKPLDRILFYTDGATEAQSEQGDFFGTERLAEAFVALRKDSAESTLEKLIEKLRVFRGGGEFQDDITLAALALMESSEDPPG
jgi:sigma-B regulation protein RsbU (phosphoserine phosphatase)